MKYPVISQERRRLVRLEGLLTELEDVRKHTLTTHPSRASIVKAADALASACIVQRTHLAIGESIATEPNTEAA